MTSPLRRLASTIFVFLALFVACLGGGATERSESAVSGSDVQAIVADDDGPAGAGDPGGLPLLEDNGGGLDDTFDLPSLHVVTMLRPASAHPRDIGPSPHAHHHSLELRPPIA